jgi:hypothetical protein
VLWKNLWSQFVANRYSFPLDSFSIASKPD